MMKTIQRTENEPSPSPSPCLLFSLHRRLLQHHITKSRNKQQVGLFQHCHLQRISFWKQYLVILLEARQIARIVAENRPTTMSCHYLRVVRSVAQYPKFQRRIGLPSLVRHLSSVSSAEVGKFSALSKTWWDPKENPLIGMNAIRMQYIQDQIIAQRNDASKTSSDQPPLEGLKALDVGCGGGLLSESLARLGAQVTAIDPSVELVEAARLHSQLDPRTRKIEFQGGSSVEDLTMERKEEYDIICLLEVLEHVTDPDSILSSIHRLLKPNGKLFLSTLNRTTKSKLVAIWGAEYIMRYLPVGTHDWTQFRSPSEVNDLMSYNGFKPIHVTGMVINSPPFFGKWDWRLDESDVDINWIGTYEKHDHDNTSR